jgi:hypothetical protein
MSNEYINIVYRDFNFNISISDYDIMKNIDDEYYILENIYNTYKKDFDNGLIILVNIYDFIII